MFFYELREGDDDIFADVLLVREEEMDADDFFELVQEIRRRVQDTFTQDTLIEAIAEELERDHAFIPISDDRLSASVNVSKLEDDNYLASIDSDDDDDPDAPDYRGIFVDLPREATRCRTEAGPARRSDVARRRYLLNRISMTSPSLDRVRLALGAQLAVLARLGHRLQRQQVLVGHDLGADEAVRQVRVDRAGGVDRVRAVGDRPGPDLVGPRGQERDQAEQPVAEPDDPVQARLLRPSSSMKTAASSGSSSPSSISILADSASTSAPACR